MTGGTSKTPQALPPGGIRIASQLPGLYLLRFSTSVRPPEGLSAGIVAGSRRGAAIWRDGAWRSASGNPINWQPEWWLVPDLER